MIGAPGGQPDFVTGACHIVRDPYKGCTKSDSDYLLGVTESSALTVCCMFAVQDKSGATRYA